MKRYLIIVSGNTALIKPVSLTIHADDIRIFDSSFQYKIISNNMEGDRTLLTWFDIEYSAFRNLSIIWECNNFRGSLSIINVDKGEKK